MREPQTQTPGFVIHQDTLRLHSLLMLKGLKAKKWWDRDLIPILDSLNDHFIHHPNLIKILSAPSMCYQHLEEGLKFAIF